MVIQSRRFAKSDGLGFTLLELLLVVALLMGLMAAVVFNFSSLQKGSDLEEGARQFEALLRFASAQAANNGRTVQLRFSEDSGGSTNEMIDIFEMDSTLRVVWEPDPIAQPGVFVDLLDAARFLAAVKEHIRIDRVQTAMPPMNQSTNETAALATPLAGLPPLSFFPDGSSDVADIVLISKNSEDSRRVNIHLAGVIGQMKSEFQAAGELVPIEWMDEEGKPPAESESTSISSTTSTTQMGPDFSEPEDLFRETTKTNDFPEP